MPQLRDVTILFLVKKNGEAVTDILLAMKKRGFGVGRWNGPGGKVHEGETIEEAARREAKEEALIEAEGLEKIAEIDFFFPYRPEFEQKAHVYFAENWQGKPTETEEMCPKWFALEEIPFEKMWADDIYWLPEVLKGKKLKCSFTFGEGDVVLEKSVREVDGLYL